MRWFLVFFMVVPSLSFAQVNVEALRSNGTENGVSGSTGLSVAYTGGNIQFADFGASAHLEWKKEKNLLFFVLNYRFAAKRTQADILAEPDIGLWDEEAHFSNNRLAHLRYNRTLTESVWWEVYTQYEYNEFLLLDRRLLVGTGPRARVFDVEAAGLWFGVSAMVEEERLNEEGVDPAEEVSRINGRDSTYASLTARLAENASWTSTVYAQPRMDAVDDYRVVVETGLSLGIGKALAVTIDGRYRKDSQPPQTPSASAPILSSDFSIKNGLKVSF